jgi:hypothetical protein
MGWTTSSRFECHLSRSVSSSSHTGRLVLIPLYSIEHHEYRPFRQRKTGVLHVQHVAPDVAPCLVLSTEPNTR